MPFHSYGICGWVGVDVIGHPSGVWRRGGRWHLRLLACSLRAEMSRGLGIYFPEAWRPCSTHELASYRTMQQQSHNATLVTTGGGGDSAGPRMPTTPPPPRSCATPSP